MSRRWYVLVGCEDAWMGRCAVDFRSGTHQRTSLVVTRRPTCGSACTGCSYSSGAHATSTERITGSRHVCPLRWPLGGDAGALYRKLFADVRRMSLLEQQLAVERQQRVEEQRRVAALQDRQAQERQERARARAQRRRQREAEEREARRAERRRRERAARRAARADPQVYFTEYGQCWHTVPDCYGLRKAYSVYTGGLSTATWRGLRPCRCCAL